MLEFMALLIATDIRNKETALIFLKVVCKNTLKKFFNLEERKSEFNKAGVGNVKYIDGTGVFKN